jgi:hypothetical protein
MKRALILFVGVLCEVSAHAQSPASEAPIKTTLCEIKQHPEKFLHKLVEFTAIASHGFEDSMVESSECTWKSDPSVWMEFGGKRSTDTMYCCGFSPKPDRPEVLKIDGLELPLDDDDLFQRFNNALQSHPRKGKSVTVQATLRGRIFAEQIKLAQNASGYWAGYGHMGCCMLFVVTQVVSVGKTETRPD